MERFRAGFTDLADPRTGNAQRHDLLEIVLIALAATLAGAETCVDMAEFGRAKEPFLRRFLALPGGIPSHDTFSRLFRLLDPAVNAGRNLPRSAEVNAPPALSGAGCSADGSSAARSMGLRAATRARPEERRRQRDHGPARASGPALPRRLHRDRRRHALPEGDRPGDPRPGRRLCAGVERQPAGAARGRPRAARRSGGPA